MPLLDESGSPTRVLAAREEDRIARERGAALGGGSYSDVTDALLKPTRNTAPNTAMFSDLLKTVLGPQSSTPSFDGLTGSALTTTNLPSVVTDPPAPGGIIGTKNYQVGHGNTVLRSIAEATGWSMGWGSNEFPAWDALINAESSWDPNAQNKTSTAFGLGQFLNSTWSGVGGTKTTNPAQQLALMARYIKNRYGSPTKALAFHASHNWY